MASPDGDNRAEIDNTSNAGGVLERDIDRLHKSVRLYSHSAWSSFVVLTAWVA